MLSKCAYGTQGIAPLGQPSYIPMDKSRGFTEGLLMPQSPEPPYFTPGNIVVTLLGFALAFGLALLVMQP
jgi:hypothetical protein